MIHIPARGGSNEWMEENREGMNVPKECLCNENRPAETS